MEILITLVFVKLVLSSCIAVELPWEKLNKLNVALPELARHAKLT